MPSPMAGPGVLDQPPSLSSKIPDHHVGSEGCSGHGKSAGQPMQQQTGVPGVGGQEPCKVQESQGGAVRVSRYESKGCQLRAGPPRAPVPGGTWFWQKLMALSSIW